MSPTEDTPLLDNGLLAEMDATTRAKETLAELWIWVLVAGICSVIGGTTLVTTRITTTHDDNVVLLWTCLILLVIGCIHMTGWWFAEHSGLKRPFFVLGCVETVLALWMKHYYNQEDNSSSACWTVWTITICLVYILDGLYRVALAQDNRNNMPGWKMMLAHGWCAMLFSLLILLGTFFSSSFSIYTIGLVVGVNFIMSGILRIYLAFLGYRLGSRATNHNHETIPMTRTSLKRKKQRRTKRDKKPRVLVVPTTSIENDNRDLMILTGQRVAFDDEREDEVITGHEVLMKHLTGCETPVIGGTTQTATLYFCLLTHVKGLTLTQRTYRGAIGPFTKIVQMGDYNKGDNHKYTFEQDVIPDGFLERGHYTSLVEYTNSDRVVLTKYTSRFCICKREYFHQESCQCSFSESNHTGASESLDV